MQMITRTGLVRIVIVMVALPVIAKFAMCDCGRERTALNNVPSISAKNLSRHVHYIAGELGEHNVTIPWALKKAADYIEAEWRAQGHNVTRWFEEAVANPWENLLGGLVLGGAALLAKAHAHLGQKPAVAARHWSGQREAANVRSRLGGLLVGESDERV